MWLALYHCLTELKALLLLSCSCLFDRVVHLCDWVNSCLTELWVVYPFMTDLIALVWLSCSPLFEWVVHSCLTELFSCLTKLLTLVWLSCSHLYGWIVNPCLTEFTLVWLSCSPLFEIVARSCMTELSTLVWLSFMKKICNMFQILGFGLSTLQGIDPNPDNFVSSAILHTRSQQVGCLVRLEPNKQMQVWVDGCFLCLD